AANVCAAEFVQERHLPALYRNHEGPKDEKLLKLKGYLGIMGVEFPAKPKLTPADFQKVLKSVAERPDASIVETMLLRSMMQAVYSPENLGHFGLAYPAYAHFTSPIRRYPDLLLHRVIRHYLHHPEANPHVDMATMVALGEHCSMAERRADEATRDVTAWLKCEYMQDHIGDTFKGVITAVTSFGFFVALDDIFVEGLVHIRNLEGDFYNFDPVMHTLTGSRTGVVYAMGDKVQIRVAGVNLDERKMDFELEGRLNSARRSKKPAVAPADAPAEGKTAPKPRPPRQKAPAKAKVPAPAPAQPVADGEAKPKAKKPRNRNRGKPKAKQENKG
ncbi:MAG TPA: RNB domain-containing ribonuclease, partial [Fluviicoccus sp.]|nr:RNB domain-containing ribonuclease [Fluviicoccus sp.]